MITLSPTPSPGWIFPFDSAVDGALVALTLGKIHVRNRATRSPLFPDGPSNTRIANPVSLRKFEVLWHPASSSHDGKEVECGSTVIENMSEGSVFRALFLRLK